ncbi:hypothetical protein DXC92_01585 [Clostridiales bacterium TF09-2AC]|nr:hypothetical protein DXC92_01585 [Clostridiales bacterium TF09-2AC]
MNTIEKYDYTASESIADQVLVEVEELDNRQRVLLHEAIARIKRDTEADDTQKHIRWFDTVILPLLKDFAELTSSSLEIQRDEIGIITTCIRNSNGLDITESCHGMYLALLLAVQIDLDADNDETVLTLIYDCRKFIQ